MPQPAVLWLARADHRIEPFADHVHKAIADVEVEVDLRLRLAESANRWERPLGAA